LSVELLLLWLGNRTARLWWIFVGAGGALCCLKALNVYVAYLRGQYACSGLFVHICQGAKVVRECCGIQGSLCVGEALDCAVVVGQVLAY